MPPKVVDDAALAAQDAVALLAPPTLPMLSYEAHTADLGDTALADQQLVVFPGGLVWPAPAPNGLPARPVALNTNRAEGNSWVWGGLLVELVKTALRRNATLIASETSTKLALERGRSNLSAGLIFGVLGVFWLEDSGLP
jgi:hypothetical protein